MLSIINFGFMVSTNRKATGVEDAVEAETYCPFCGQRLSCVGPSSASVDQHNSNVALQFVAHLEACEGEARKIRWGDNGDVYVSTVNSRRLAVVRVSLPTGEAEDGVYVHMMS